jgi:hypothetical protein
MKGIRPLAIGALMIGVLGLAGCFSAPGYYGGYGAPAYGYSSYPAWGYSSYPALGYRYGGREYRRPWNHDEWNRWGHDEWIRGGHRGDFAGAFGNRGFAVARNHAFRPATGGRGFIGRRSFARGGGYHAGYQGNRR